MYIIHGSKSFCHEVPMQATQVEWYEVLWFRYMLHSTLIADALGSQVPRSCSHWCWTHRFTCILCSLIFIYVSWNSFRCLIINLLILPQHNSRSYDCMSAKEKRKRVVLHCLYWDPNYVLLQFQSSSLPFPSQSTQVLLLKIQQD